MAQPDRRSGGLRTERSGLLFDAAHGAIRAAHGAMGSLTRPRHGVDLETMVAAVLCKDHGGVVTRQKHVIAVGADLGDKFIGKTDLGPSAKQFQLSHLLALGSSVSDNQKMFQGSACRRSHADGWSRKHADARLTCAYGSPTDRDKSLRLQALVDPHRLACGRHSKRHRECLPASSEDVHRLRTTA